MKRCMCCSGLLEKKNEIMCMECAEFVFKGRNLEASAKKEVKRIKK